MSGTARAAGMVRPRIKPQHAACRTIDGNVRIGGVIHGIGAEIEDPDGWIWTLTQAMDGYDRLLLCADEPREIRRWANRACLAASIPWVCGGYTVRWPRPAS